MSAAAAGVGARRQDADQWREAASLRRDHTGWVIVWLAPAREFRAYRRLPGARRDSAVSAATAAGLAATIIRAEQVAPRGPGHGQSQQ